MIAHQNGGTNVATEPHSDTPAHVVVDRRVYSETEFNSKWTPKKTPKPSASQRIGGCCRETCACSGACWRDAIYQYLPFIRIMKKYNIKRDLVGDVVAGITVGIMQIPQGRTAETTNLDYIYIYTYMCIYKPTSIQVKKIHWRIFIFAENQN